MKRRSIALILVVAAAAACEQKPKTEPAAQPPQAQAAQPAPVARTTPDPSSEQESLESVAVSEDFEETATREITADNLDSQMDALEKELAE